MIEEDTFETRIIELSTELPAGQGVCFDPDQLCLAGFYGDELSAYRARKSWIDTLETAFLLDLDHDFSIAIEANKESGKFITRCKFQTACARYAFWRLTNAQAPEAQYQIETAHIPHSETRHADFIQATDLRSVYEGEPVPLSFGSPTRQEERSTLQHNQGFYRLLKKLIDRIGRL